MKTAPVRLAGPADDTRRDHRATLSALHQAAARSAELWRHVTDANAPVPGLTWTAGETAAHVVGDLRDYISAVTRYAHGYMTHADRNSGTPSALSAIVNARHLTVVPERNLHRLADMLEEEVDRYLAVAAAAADQSEVATIPTPNGLVLPVPTMTTLLLGEQLIHGLDVARADQIAWPISRGDALSVIPGVLSVAPQYLHPRRSANLSVSFELRMRGGSRYRMAVQHGTAVVTAAGAKADCTITADPVAFLLLGYGRAPQWPQVIRGKLRAGGRKPWLATKFGGLLTSP
jgi:hypothetical protein